MHVQVHCPSFCPWYVAHNLHGLIIITSSSHLPPLVGLLERVSACSSKQPLSCRGGVHNCLRPPSHIHRSPRSAFSRYWEHLIQYLAFLARVLLPPHLSATPQPRARALALLELCTLAPHIPHPPSAQRHLWLSPWLPFTQSGRYCVGVRCCFFGATVCSVVGSSPPPTHLTQQVVALLFPAICQVPFALHMPVAIFGALMAALLTSSANGTCDLLCKVANASGSCSRLLSIFNRLGDTVHEVLWQYSSAMGFVLNKVCCRCGDVYRQWGLYAHPNRTPIIAHTRLLLRKGYRRVRLRL